MSSTSIELFRQHTEKQRQKAQDPERTPQKAQAPSEAPEKPSLIAQMSRIEHEVRQVFDDAPAGDRDNIIRYVELLIRNLKRARQGDDE